MIGQSPGQGILRIGERVRGATSFPRLSGACNGGPERWELARGPAVTRPLLSGFQLPWPPSNCLYAKTEFVVSDERAFGRVKAPFGSSRIASSAYQKWPTNRARSECPRPMKRQGPRTHSEFESARRALRPPNAQSLLYRMRLSARLLS